MLKKFLTGAAVFLSVFLAGVLYLNFSGGSQLRDDLISPPKTYYSSGRSIQAAVLTQKDTKVLEVNRRNLQHAAITLINALKNDQDFRQIIVIFDPSLPETDPDPFFEQIRQRFPQADYRIIRPTAEQGEADIYNQLGPLNKETLLILHSYLNFSDFDRDLLTLQKQHYKNVFDNLNKAALGTLALTNSEAAKAIYQYSKENDALKALPTLEDQTHEYQIKYLASGLPTPSNIVTLTFFGDIMLDRHVRTLMNVHGLDYPFRNMDRAYLQMNDLLIANLEGPVAEKRVATTKSIAFRFLPDVVPLLKKYYFDALSLANNHALDMGGQGLEDSWRLLREGQITPFGHPRDITSDSTALFQINGQKIAFLGLNHTDFKLKKTEAIAKINQLRDQGYKVIPFIHWGNEYVHTPTNEQVTMAHEFVDAGAVAVIGMHPHVVESVEIYNDAPIFYSLGNAIFDQYFSPDTQEGLSTVLRFTSDEIQVYLFPIKIENSQFRLMLPEEKKVFLARLAEWWRYDQETKEQILEGKIVIKFPKS